LWSLGVVRRISSWPRWHRCSSASMPTRLICSGALHRLNRRQSTYVVTV
jgi:hypothetical protein